MNSLGISYSSFHDSSAVLLVDGKLTFASSEERYSRICHDGAVPIEAVKAALESSNLTPKDINHTTIAWAHPLRSFLHGLSHSFSFGGSLGFSASHTRALMRQLWRYGGARPLENEFGPLNINFCDHHLSHALSAYAYSGFKDSTVVVIDGKGSFEATSIWRATNGKIEPVQFIKWPNSLGLLYANFTSYLGFKPLSDEWKVMGLAAYGSPGVDLSSFITEDPFPYQVNTSRVCQHNFGDCKGIESILGPRRLPDDEITQHHKDIAFALQQIVEKLMLAIVESAVEKTGIKNVCLAGGVVMNCKANGYIANSKKIDKFFIQPAAADDGAALGAAVYPYILQEGRIPQIEFPSMYLGPEYSDEYIENTLKSYKISYERLSQRPQQIAELLASGNIVGHFNGRMEFGARALGNRSILADSRDIENKMRVNNMVKYREDWRPFAPSILEEYYSEFFDTTRLSPHMILSFPVKAEKADSIAATTHVDHTARPQTVMKSTNLDYWELIDSFREITGVPVVLNTSFNLKGEPIVNTPTDAIRTFYSSGLDALVLNNFLVKKQD